MSRFNPNRDAAPVLDAAQQWMHRCLIDEGSLFGDLPLWRGSTTDELRRVFTDNPDESNASFFDKLEGQMATASPEAKRLMAEMLWVLMLFQSNIGPAKKREGIGRVWGWSGSDLDLTHPLLSGPCLVGIGNPGTAFNTMRWRELNYLIGLAADLQERSRDERLAILSDRERFESWIASAPQEGYRQFRHIFRYLAFPDQNERITQTKDRRAILAAFTDLDPDQFRGWSDKQQDDQLLLLRQRLETELGTPEFDFYAPPLAERWRHGSTPSQPKQSPSFELGYAELRERFLAKYPGFTSFATSAGYIEDERGYKDELLHLFEQTVEPLLADADWPAAGGAAIELLTKPLQQAANKPQNIVGWRYIEILRRLGAEQRAAFARHLNDLLDEEKPIEARVDDFVDQLRRLNGDGKKLLPAAIRSITGFYLALSAPARHIFMKTSEIQRALRKLEPSFQWRSGGLAGDEVAHVEGLATRIFDRLAEEKWAPKDLLDAQGFLWAAITGRGEVAEDGADEIEEHDPILTKPAMPMNSPLNQILFGPPGTGKTYHAITKALEVLDPALLATTHGAGPEGRRLAKHRFDELAKEGRVQFVTFHQSFSYEDFVEGLRADTDEETGSLRYEIADGVFKRLCDSARTRLVKEAELPMDIAGRRIWKLSLGDYVTESHIYEECIKNGTALMGFGANADFSNSKTRDDIQKTFAEAGEQLPLNAYSITAINTFVNQMKKGDLVVVTEGNLRFRAIGEITGDYRTTPRESGDSYTQCRDVRWLRVYKPALAYDALMENRFSQMTIYELREGSIDLGKLRGLLRPRTEVGDNTLPRVLIIDEINRGNVSRIFGELITLIEPSKRAGADEALEAVLPYSKERFSVPGNVYLIGTMNTADRSLAGLDIALRRRFEFVEMPARPELLADVDVDGIDIEAMLTVMNQRIEVLLDRDHHLGHAYFMPLIADPSLKRLGAIFQNQILPLLQEYFFEDWERIRWVLNDQHKKGEGHCFVVPPAHNVLGLFGGTAEVPVDARLWELDPTALGRRESYLGIIDANGG